MVILILAGGLQYGWEWDSLTITIVLVLIACGYGLICLYTSQEFQLLTAKVLTVIFSLAMSAAFIGILIQVVENPLGDQNPMTTPGIVLNIPTASFRFRSF